MGGSNADEVLPALTLVESTDRSATFARWTGSNVLFCTGELRAESSPDLREVLTTVTEQAPDQVVVDLAAVTAIDDDALRTFVDARTSLHERGADLVVRAPTAPVAKALARAGLADPVRSPEERHQQPPASARLATGWDDAVIGASWRKLCATQAFGAADVSFVESARLVSAIGRLIGDPVASPRPAHVREVLAAARCSSAPEALAAVQLVALNRAGHRWIDDHAVANATHHRWSSALDGATSIALTAVLDEMEDPSPAVDAGPRTDDRSDPRRSGYGATMARHPLEDVDEEVARQAAIDASEADPATKVAERDRARAELEAKQDVEPDPGPNPS